MKYNRCIKCEINYVEKPALICSLCKSVTGEVGSCIYCGGAAASDNDVCDVCRESISAGGKANIFLEED